jgi:prepilin-type N-terminal cleavage/methylation domain-containing protein
VKSEKLKVNDGYTLIEILVSLTIIGLIFSFGYVSFRDFSRRQVVAGVAKTIQGDLRLTQSNAMTGQKPSGCATTLDTFSFRVVSSTSYTIEANCGGAAIAVKDVTLPTGIAISTPTPNPLKFKILGQGTNIPQDGSAVIILTQTTTNNTATVTVTSGGEIK